MENQPTEDNKAKKNNDDASIKPDPETLNTTDPQDHMKGPVSSPAKEAIEGIEDEKADEDHNNE